jgi:hypothetical protein
MRERERLLWGALIVLLLIVAGYMGYNVYRMGRQVREYKEAMVREALGSEDPQLRETIEQLEVDLSNRMDFTFDIDEDPLELTQVIQGQRFLAQLGFTESLESQARMRLSCTVISTGEPVAVIKFGGRSRILRVGDEIDGYRVTEIGQQRAVLISPEETLVLNTEKAPDTIQKERRMQEGPITVGSTENSPAAGNF